MTWKPEIEDLQHRRQRALAMGGPERIAKQHAQGKLAARERITRLLDRDSFTELGMLSARRTRPTFLTFPCVCPGNYPLGEAIDNHNLGVG